MTDSKEVKTRTSITISPSLFEAAKARARERHASFSALVEEALRAALSGEAQCSAPCCADDDDADHGVEA